MENPIVFSAKKPKLIFEKVVKTYFLRVLYSIVRDVFFYLFLFLFIYGQTIEKLLTTYSLLVPLPFLLFTVSRSVLINIITIQKILFEGDDIHITFLKFNYEQTIANELNKTTFLDFSGHKSPIPYHISLYFDSKKVLTQYFEGNYKMKEFDELRKNLEDAGMKKPYGYNL